jgi:hypothetical protein
LIWATQASEQARSLRFLRYRILFNCEDAILILAIVEEVLLRQVVDLHGSEIGLLI